MEARADMDRILIAVLQAEGELTQAIAAQLQQALLSSRKIGAAIGIIMANRGIDELGAFNVLSNASQKTNRKLRDVADEVVSMRRGLVASLVAKRASSSRAGGLLEPHCGGSTADPHSAAHADILPAMPTPAARCLTRCRSTAAPRATAQRRSSVASSSSS